MGAVIGDLLPLAVGVAAEARHGTDVAEVDARDRPVHRRQGRRPGAAAVGHRVGRLRADLVAGVTVRAVLVSESPAYAIIAGIPPVVGL